MSRAFEELTAKHFDLFIGRDGERKCEISEPGYTPREPNESEVMIIEAIITEKLPEALKPCEPGDRVSILIDRASLSFRASIYLANKDSITGCVGAIPEPQEVGADEVERFMKEFTRNKQFFARLTAHETQQGAIFLEEVLAPESTTLDALAEMKTAQSLNTLNLMLRKLNEQIYKGPVKGLTCGERVEIEIDLRRGYFAGEKMSANGSKKRIAGVAKTAKTPKPSDTQNYRL